MYRVALPIGGDFPDEGAAPRPPLGAASPEGGAPPPPPTRIDSSRCMFAPSASRARRAGFRGRNAMAASTCRGSTDAAPPAAATRCASSSTSRAESVRGISLLICFSVQPSAAPPPIGWGVVAMLLRTIRFVESAWAARRPSGRLDGADAHPKSPFDLSQQPGGELLVGWVLLLDHFQHLVVDVGQQLQELAVVHSPPPRPPAWYTRWPNGQIVDGSAQQKKRPAGRFPLRATPLDVRVLDLRHLGGLVMMPGATVHPARQQVV